MDSAWSEFDITCMRRALELAEHGRGQVAPNPPVGCVLVREGKIIAEGWHDHLGDLHAEQDLFECKETERHTILRLSHSRPTKEKKTFRVAWSSLSRTQAVRQPSYLLP